MTRILVDTNVLVSFLTDRDVEQQARAAQLLEAAAGRELELVLHQQVLSELVCVLANLYGRPCHEVSDTLRELIALPGIVVMSDLPWGLVLELWPVQLPDFADAALVAACRVGDHDAIATFDHAFRRRLPALGIQTLW